MKRYLLFSKQFLPLVGVAFCSAFIDNAVRLITVAQVMSSEHLRQYYFESGLSGLSFLPNYEAASVLIALAVFSAPFILFAVSAGRISSGNSRQQVVIYSMVASLGLVALFVIAMLYADVRIAFVVLFLLGLKSAILSPAKYVSVNDITEPEENGEGVALLVASTTLGVLLGSFYSVLWILSESMLDGSFGQQSLLWIFSLLGVFGVLFSLSLPDTPVNSDPAAEEGPVFSWFDGFWRPILALRTREPLAARYLLLAVLGLALFWSLGSVQQISISFTAGTNAWTPMLTAVLLSALALGVCYGAVVAAKASAAQVELGLLPVSMILLAVAHISIGMCQLSYAKYFPLLFLLGFGGAFLAIPCYTYLLNKSPRGQEPLAIAVSNAVIHLGVFLSLLMLSLSLSKTAMSPSRLYLYSGIICSALILYLLTLVPGIFLRFVNWLLVHTLYRLSVYDTERIPKEGGALLVCNHLSFVDAMLVLAAIDRPVRFLIYRPIYENRFVKPFARAMGAIPVEAGRSREEVDRALSAASEGIRSGELVCIFAEGGISRVGRLLPFKRGLERIMADVSAPIIPVYLDQIWGSIFSYRGGRFFWKRPKAIPLPVSMHVGEPMHSAATAVEVRRAVQSVAVDAFQRRPMLAQDLRLAMLESLGRNRFSRRVTDSGGTSLKAFELLAAVALLRPRIPGERGGRLGICLPPTVAGVIANLSIVAGGKTPVNLNYTASTDGLQSAIRQAEITTVITSRKFCEKIGISFEDMSLDVMLMEDVLAQSSRLKNLSYALACALLPRRILARMVFGPQRFASSSDEAADFDAAKEVLSILFSSGSTGEPKGVMLSHRNVSSNITSLLDLLDLDTGDSLIGILPFFHSFGHTATLWYPLIAGIPVAYHSNPMDARTIGRMIAAQKGRVLFATPTFLKMYLRKGKAEDFSRLRFLVVGAERLPDAVRDSCVEKFNLTPLEGYGCTELSPLAIVNVPDIEHGKIRQAGTKFGSVGTPIPGVNARVVDPESFSERETDEEGMLLIKGPNVMLGYLNKDELTREVVTDGWYRTGDIARIDKDGFVEIVGRLSRFAKIAGEMVPLGQVEERIAEMLQGDSGEEEDAESGNAVAVCSVPDEKKGEKLVVLSQQVLDATEVARHLKNAGFPNLWIPAQENYHQVEEIPLLGSGKRDLKALDSLAREL